MTDYKISSQVFNSDGKEYSSFNIEYFENGKSECIHDVCTDRDAVEEFVDKLNRTDTDPIHIHELVEDFLAAL